jgi:hypothetical protein
LLKVAFCRNREASGWPPFLAGKRPGAVTFPPFKKTAVQKVNILFMELRIKNYELNYELRITNYELRIVECPVGDFLFLPWQRLEYGGL